MILDFLVSDFLLKVLNMCGLSTNKVSLDSANIPRYRLTYESKPDGLAKGLGSDSFTIPSSFTSKGIMASKSSFVFLPKLGP